jgi:uncharacterized membrane protein
MAMTRDAARRFPLLVLAYLGPTAIIPLVANGGDREIRWHAWHGLLLVVIEVAVIGGLTAVAGLTALSNLAGGITLGVIAWIAWVTALAVQLTAMLTALNGGRLGVPLISALATRVDNLVSR